MTAVAPERTIQAPRYATPVRYKRTLGDSVIEFGEQLPVVKGPGAGKPTQFLNWQRWLARRLLEVTDDDHLRYRRGLVGVARQNGKGFFGSRLGLHGLVRGPAGNEVYSVAADRTQARIVFGEARRLVQSHQYLSEHCVVYRDAIEVPSTGAVYRVLSSDAGLQQGLSPFLVIFDEIHVQKNEDLWDALTMGMGARPDALCLGITTAGFDEDSLAGRLYDYGKAICEGETTDDAFGMWWWEPEKTDCDIHDHEAWFQANPSLAEGGMLLDDMEAAANSAREAAFRRFRLNQWVPLGGEQWMSPHLWDAAVIDNPDEWTEPPDGSAIVVGFDGSVSRDATAMIGIDLDTMVMWPIRIWEPHPTDMDWQVPREEVDATVKGLFERYDVRALGGDPAWWRYELQEWEDDWPERVFQWPTTNSRMAAACNTFYAWVSQKTIRHTGDPALRRHILNSIVKDLGPLGDSIRKIKRDSKKWIDAAVAATIAVDMAERFSDPDADDDDSGELWTFS